MSATRRLAATTACAATLLLALSCSKDYEQIGTPGKEFELRVAELIAVTRAARAGDLASIKRLVNYYTWVSDNPEKAIPWLRAGAAKGDIDSMWDLSGRISESGEERDCREARELLDAALALAGGARHTQMQEDLDLLTQGIEGEGPCVRWLHE